MAAQREWFEKDYYAGARRRRRRVAEGHHQGLPQAGARAAPRQEPGQRRRRGALQGGVGRLRRARRRDQAHRVRRGAPARPDGRRGRRAVGAVASVQRRRHAGAGAGLGDLLGQMFGRGGGAAGRCVGRRAAARRATSAPSSRRLRRRRARPRPPRCTSPPTRSARRATARAPSPARAPKVCPVCGGRGVVDDNQGLFSFSTPCRVAPVTGSVIEEPCPTCHGSGIERRPARCRPASRRRERRADDPPQGPRWSGAQRRPGRRPARRHQA